MGKKSFRKSAADNFEKAMTIFGETIGEVFEDPELRKKALQFSQDVMFSAAKIAASKLGDGEVKDKFVEVGKAAEHFGKSLEDQSEAEKA